LRAGFPDSQGRFLTRSAGNSSRTARARWVSLGSPTILHQVPMRLIRLVLALSLALAPLGADAQRTGKIPQLCFLTFDPGTGQSPSARFDGFFHGLRDLGYVHGQTITINYLVADGRSERFPELAAECVRLKAENRRD